MTEKPKKERKKPGPKPKKAAGAPPPGAPSMTAAEDPSGAVSGVQAPCAGGAVVEYSHRPGKWVRATVEVDTGEQDEKGRKLLSLRVIDTGMLVGAAPEGTAAGCWRVPA